MYPAAGIIEGMGRGWDFSWIDMQHGQHDSSTALCAVRAAEVMGLHTVVRVPGHNPDTMSVVADMDPDAVMVPVVDSASDAQAAVAALRFPPTGRRSYGGRRVIDRHGRDYYKDRDLLVIAQIETLEALGCIDEIAAVNGVDVLFLGPDDMKVRMGLDMATSIQDHPQLQQAVSRVAEAARSAGKFSGIVAVTPGLLADVVGQGYQLIVGGGDIMFLRTGATDTLNRLRQAVSECGSDGTDGGRSIYGN